MAIHRTYVAKMPTDAGNMPYLDILVEGPVGEPSAPVKLAAGGTTPPNGWQTGTGFNVDGDGQFYELRGRPTRIEQPFGAVNNDVSSFVPRLALGWQLGVVCTDSNSDEGCSPLPSVLYSASLVGQPAAPFNVQGIAQPNEDPDYGPVIRLLNSPDVQGLVYMVHISIMEPKDEDRTPTGGL